MGNNSRFKTVIPRNSDQVSTDFDIMLAYGDMHIPYQQNRCRDILLSIMDIVQPTHLLSGGDDIDAEALSFFGKEAHQEISLQRDLDEFYIFSEHINERFPRIHKFYLKDNHMYERLEKHKRIVKWMQSMKMFEFESLIKAEEHGWEVYDEFIWNETILFTHGNDEKGSADNPVNTVRNNFKRFGYSIVRFHTHVTGLELHRHLDRTAIAFQIGTFQDLTKATYIKSKQRANWSTSAAIFYLNKRTNEFYVEPLLFFNNGIMFRGMLFK